MKRLLTLAAALTLLSQTCPAQEEARTFKDLGLPEKW